MRRSLVVLALAVATATRAAAPTARTEAARLRFSVPHVWTRVPATSDVRAAQFRIPRAPGDEEDGELVLFFFGAGQGGGAEDNLRRWYGQFEQPDGKASQDAAVVTIRTIDGLRVTSVDLPGTYVGMAPKAARKAGWRLLGAVIEGDGGPWYFKATGPAATIEGAKADFEALLRSLEVHR